MVRAVHAGRWPITARSHLPRSLVLQAGRWRRSQRVNPAASAASSSANHTAALVRLKAGDDGVWYRREFVFPLTVQPSGPEPSDADAAERGPNGCPGSLPAT